MAPYLGQNIAFLNVEDVRLTDIRYAWPGRRGGNPDLFFRLARIRIALAREPDTTLIRQFQYWKDLRIGFGPEPLDVPHAMQNDAGFRDCCPPQTPVIAEISKDARRCCALIAAARWGKKQ